MIINLNNQVNHPKQQAEHNKSAGCQGVICGTSKSEREGLQEGIETCCDAWCGDEGTELEVTELMMILLGVTKWQG